jgi:hypothetical protein
MGLIENVKDVVSLVQKMDNIDLYRKILDLQADALRLTTELLSKDEGKPRNGHCPGLPETLQPRSSPGHPSPETF